jgi:hypothetical protein
MSENEFSVTFPMSAVVTGATQLEDGRTRASQVVCIGVDGKAAIVLFTDREAAEAFGAAHQGCTVLTLGDAPALLSFLRAAPRGGPELVAIDPDREGQSARVVPMADVIQRIGETEA